MFSLPASSFLPSEAKSHEWLISNGLGGYSSSTAIGMNSRKYHGLLVAPLKGTCNRHVLLSKLEETAAMAKKQFQLSTNQYPGATFPEGFKNQCGFSFSDHPTFTYSLDGAILEKSVRMPRGKNAAVISYRLKSGREAELLIRPMLSARPIHQDPATRQTEIPFIPDHAGFTTKKPSAMRVCASFGKFTPAPLYYNNMEYGTENERGYKSTETLFSPGFFSTTVSKGDELHICASLEMLSPSEALSILDGQEMRFRHLSEAYSRASGIDRTDFGDSLLLASDSFVNASANHIGITAGFPWFGEWARDTMISLPGLLLSTGRYALAREMLRSYSLRMKGGLLPNLIDEEGKAHYTSADASLWFINAVQQYAAHTQDYAFIRQSLWKPMREFLSATMEGNRLIGMAPDCLLCVSDPASTWMDAKIDGKAVTPRKGKPVEINALWYSNLHFMRDCAMKFGDARTAALCLQIIDTLDSSFHKFFSPHGWLYDTIEPNDASLRPNQLFAISLPHSPLNTLQQKHIFHAVRSRLYTPLGLRTLSPEDPHYHGTYSGNQGERDLAYHQGAIWPWLLGAFYDAQLKAYPGSEHQVLAALRPFSEAMKEGCIGTLPELYEPKSMKPAGAISQAWSVAEILRIYTKVKKSSSPQNPEHRVSALHIQ